MRLNRILIICIAIILIAVVANCHSVVEIKSVNRGGGVVILGCSNSEKIGVNGSITNMNDFPVKVEEFYGGSLLKTCYIVPGESIGNCTVKGEFFIIYHLENGFWKVVAVIKPVVNGGECEKDRDQDRGGK